MRSSLGSRCIAAATWLALLPGCSGGSGSESVLATSPVASPRPKAAATTPAVVTTSPSSSLSPTAVTALASNPTPPAEAGPPVEFRQGLNGYGGVTDVGVSNEGLAKTGGRGLVTDGPTLGAHRMLDGDGHEVRSFLRFEGLQALQGRRVRYAELGLTFRGGARGHALSVQPLNRAWMPGGARFGWTQTGTGERWDVPGGGTGDWEDGPVATVSGFTGSNADVRAVTLPVGLVQQWIDRPGSNHGVALVPVTHGYATWLRSSEDPQAEWRPTLRVWLH